MVHLKYNLDFWILTKLWVKYLPMLQIIFSIRGQNLIDLHPSSRKLYLTYGTSGPKCAQFPEIGIVVYNSKWYSVSVPNNMLTFCLFINSVVRVENFILRFLLLTKISIFNQNFDFWSKFRFLSKILIFNQNFDFWAKFRLFFYQNFDFWKKLDFNFYA